MHRLQKFRNLNCIRWSVNITARTLSENLSRSPCSNIPQRYCLKPPHKLINNGGRAHCQPFATRQIWETYGPRAMWTAYFQKKRRYLMLKYSRSLQYCSSVELHSTTSRRNSTDAGFGLVSGKELLMWCLKHRRPAASSWTQTPGRLWRTHNLPQFFGFRPRQEGLMRSDFGQEIA